MDRQWICFILLTQLSRSDLWSVVIKTMKNIDAQSELETSSSTLDTLVRRWRRRNSNRKNYDWTDFSAVTTLSTHSWSDINSIIQQTSFNTSTPCKVKVLTLDMAPLHESSPQKRSGMALVLKGFHSFTCIPTRSSAIRRSHTIAFPAMAGTHLLTLEGWKAKLAWVAGSIVRQFTCPKAVTHPTTNRAQCRVTALIETNTLYTSLFTIMVAENKNSKRLNKLQQCEAKQLN